MNTWCPESYKVAWQFATRKHAGQTYGGAEEGERIPYINHLASVTMEVSLAAVTTPEPVNATLAVQCALLHDTIEDTDATYDEVSSLFGAEVAEGVLALSKDTNLPTKQAQMQDSLQRIQQQPKEVWMVKLADRITNLYRPPFYWHNDKILAYQSEAQLILDALGSSNAVLTTRLAEKISAYPQFLKSL